LENSNGTRNFLKIELSGAENNPLGIGTKIQLQTKKGIQYYEHHTTRGYMSSVDANIHFGLQDHDTVSVNVLWPDGRFEALKDIPTNQTITLLHNNARPTSKPDTLFFQSKKVQRPLFEEVSSRVDLRYRHHEKDIIDFNIQGVLPHKLSQNGPCLAKGDFNGDGLEDFIIGSSSGFSPVIFFQTKNGSFKEKELFSSQDQMQYEEESIVAFDLENDGI
jgi:enediyne biosynthesis protein E4